MILDTSVHGNQTVHWDLLQQHGRDLMLFAIVKPKSKSKPKSEWTEILIGYWGASNLYHFEYYSFVAWAGSCMQYIYCILAWFICHKSEITHHEHTWDTNPPWPLSSPHDKQHRSSNKPSENEKSLYKKLYIKQAHVLNVKNNCINLPKIQSNKPH